MKPKDFKRWRKTLGLSQKAAAEVLGLKRRVVQYYEKGERDGKDVEIPKTVRLACYALNEGISDFHGPRDTAERAGEPVLRLITSGHAAAEAGEDHPTRAARPAGKDSKKTGKRPKEKIKARGKTVREKVKDKPKAKDDKPEKSAPSEER